MKAMMPLTFKEEYSGNSLKVNLGWAAVFFGSAFGIAASHFFFPTDLVGQMAAMILSLFVIGVGYGRMVLRHISRPMWQFVGIISSAAFWAGFFVSMGFSFGGPH